MHVQQVCVQGLLRADCSLPGLWDCTIGLLSQAKAGEASFCVETNKDGQSETCGLIFPQKLYIVQFTRLQLRGKSSSQPTIAALF